MLTELTALTASVVAAHRRRRLAVPAVVHHEKTGSPRWKDSKEKIDQIQQQSPAAAWYPSAYRRLLTLAVRTCGP